MLKFSTKYRELEDIQQNLDILSQDSPTLKLHFEEFQPKFDQIVANKKSLTKCLAEANLLLKRKDNLHYPPPPLCRTQEKTCHEAGILT